MPSPGYPKNFPDTQWLVKNSCAALNRCREKSKFVRGQSPYLWLVLDYLIGCPEMRNNDA